jgi:hypothetical protein
MNKIFVIAVTMLVLSGCASVSQKEQNKAEISAIKNVEIFYHPDAYAIVVRPAEGLFALASIGEAERTERRSKAFTNAVQESFPDKDLNLQFAQKLAAQIQTGGRIVKITKIERPVGDQDMFKTPAYLNAPKTPGFAPLVLRITTGYGAQSFMSSFGSIVHVGFELGGTGDQKELISTWSQEGQKGETYMQFDSLLAAHKSAYEELRAELISLAPEVYDKTFGGL